MKGAKKKADEPLEPQASGSEDSIQTAEPPKKVGRPKKTVAEKHIDAHECNGLPPGVWAYVLETAHNACNSRKTPAPRAVRHGEHVYECSVDDRFNEVRVTVRPWHEKAISAAQSIPLSATRLAQANGRMAELQAVKRAIDSGSRRDNVPDMDERIADAGVEALEAALKHSEAVAVYESTASATYDLTFPLARWRGLVDCRQVDDADV